MIHSANTANILVLARAGGIAEADIWEIDRDIIAINPNVFETFRTMIASDQTVYNRWLDRCYCASESAINSDSFAVVLSHGPQAPTSLTTCFLSNVTEDVSAYGARLPAWGRFTVPANEYVNQILRSDPGWINDGGQCLMSYMPDATSTGAATCNMFGQTPVGRKLSFALSSEAPRPEPFYTAVSDQATLTSILSAQNSSWRSTFWHNQILTLDQRVDFASGGKTRWRLIAGPTVLTRGELYDGFGWIAASNSEIADVMEAAAEGIKDRNDKTRALLQVTNLRARPETAVIAFKGSVKMNPFRLCAVTQANAVQLADFPDVEDVDMLTARQRWLSGDWLIGGSAGVIKQSDYETAYSKWPKAVELRSDSAISYTFDTQPGSLSLATALDVISDLKVSGRTVTYLGGVAGTLSPSPADIVMINNACSAAVSVGKTYPVVDYQGDHGGVGYAVLDGLFATDLGKRKLARAMVSPSFLGLTV